MSIVPSTELGAAIPASRRVGVSGPLENAEWLVPEEIPVAMSYNGRNYAVMLATPDDLDDFAVGFALTEQVLERLEEAYNIDIHTSRHGVDIRMNIAPERLDLLDIRQKRRNLVGRSGCGLCGLESADEFFTPLPAGASLSIAGAALCRALAQFETHQHLNRHTRTVHAAAFAAPDGEIRLVREDIGRHNALDKLLGAMIKAKTDTANGFILMSSRCSYEIIEKAARCGVRAVASISAPTVFAIRKAKEANIALYCRSGDEFVTIGELVCK